MNDEPVWSDSRISTRSHPDLPQHSGNRPEIEDRAPEPQPEAPGSPAEICERVAWRSEFIDLQPKERFQDAEELATYDFFDASGAAIGCAMVGRTGPDTAVQHRVMFVHVPNHDLRCARRVIDRYTGVHDFLNEMQALRDDMDMSFAHSVEYTRALPTDDGELA